MKRSSRTPPARPNHQRPANLVQATFAQVTALWQSNQYAPALELCRTKLLKLAPRHPGGLDTHPYNSGATASDTLRAGVPLVTYLGETFVSRMAGSLLHALEMPELCAASRADYVQLAIALAHDAPRRSAIRQRLSEKLSTSILYQPQRFAAQLEQLYRAMHAKSVAGQRGLIDLSQPATSA